MLPTFFIHHHCHNLREGGFSQFQGGEQYIFVQETSDENMKCDHGNKNLWKWRLTADNLPCIMQYFPKYFCYVFYVQDQEPSELLIYLVHT